ncbi:MAG: type II secretion system protein GspC [Xanthomonadaceae bacterium]|nr:type II secretion system protein GspC [Xanthomonadaceae bacterium]
MTDHLARLVQHLNPKAWDRLAYLVSLLLVVLLAHALAQLTWLLLPAPEQGLPPPPAPGATTAPGPQQVYRQIAALHLFGRAESATPAIAAGGGGGAPLDAPETQLNLTLRGIVYSPQPELARAIIATSGRADEIYRPGAQLPGGARIEQIYPDRVILLRNGRYEALRLPEESQAAPQRAASASRRQPRQAPAADNDLAAIRQQIVANPQNVATYIQGEPVNRAGGGIVGFRVFAGQNRALFEQSDLREGDIITNVNGIQLDGLDKAAEALAQLSSANSVTVTVLRDGAEHTLQIQLQD